MKTLLSLMLLLLSAASFAQVQPEVKAGSVVVGTPTGGNQGAGSINAQSIYINGVAAGGGSGTVTSVNATAVAPLCVSGVPITGTGTIALTWCSGALAAQYGGTGTSTVPTSGQLLVGNAGGTAYAPQSLSRDCTLASTGAITCLSTNGTSFGTFATQNYATPPAIGGTTPAAGAFTTLTASTSVISPIGSFAAIGSITPGSGAFTTLTSSSGMPLSSLATQSPSTIVANPTGSTAAPSAVTLGTNLSFSGSVLNATSAFSTLTGGTNTSAAMVVGTGASLSASGSGTLTATSVPVSGVSGLGTGVATFLATPSSANFAAAITGGTGTGASVFGTSPTLTTPALSGSSTGTTTLASANASATNYTITVPAVTDTLAVLGTAQSFTALQTVNLTGQTANTQVVGSLIENTTAAANGSQQEMCLQLTGQGWETSTPASQAVDWQICNSPTQGSTNPTGSLIIYSRVNGGSWTNQLNTSTSGGSLIVAGSLLPAATGVIGFGGLTTHGIISSPAQYQIQIGAANAATPNAETLTTQGSRGGTDTNVGGGSLTIQSGLGTGTGTPSTLALQVPASTGTSGTTQQTAYTEVSLSSSSVVVGDTTNKPPITLNGHLISNLTTFVTSSALSSCGTSPTISATATDAKGTITEGTTATGCTLTFLVAYASAPDCVISSPTGNTPTSYSTSTTTLTIVNASATGDKFTYHCIQ